MSTILEEIATMFEIDFHDEMSEPETPEKVIRDGVIQLPVADRILSDRTVTRTDLRLYKMIKAMTCTIDSNQMLGRRLGISGDQVISSLVNLAEKGYVQMETTDRVRYLRA